MVKNYDSIIVISKYRYLRMRAGVANFAGIIKIVIKFIKTTFKDSKKVERIRNCVPKCNLYLYFLI